MKTLLILRHAKSSWSDPNLADHDRPLKKRGKRDAPRMGQLLRDEGLVPDLMISSTAIRARKTAEAVAEFSGYEGEINLSRDLYAFDSEPYLEALYGLPDEHELVMVIGHNPGLEGLVEFLTGEWERLPTAALAQIELPIHHWQELAGEMGDLPPGRLVGLWRPRELA